uniref:Uncharacterized protein n=1 Tax=Oryza glaberrima TaxID=4538 RepID=I1Q0J9_ORYGL
MALTKKAERLDVQFQFNPVVSRLDALDVESLRGLSPKVMVVTEQEVSHNAAGLTERFVEALNYYAALFDCLEVGGASGSVERTRVERWLLGEEIKNIVACDGGERRERHERLEGAGFGRVPLSYYALLQARRVAQGLGCDGFKVQEEKGNFFLCWQDRALFSVSAWRGRRFAALLPLPPSTPLPCSRVIATLLSSPPRHRLTPPAAALLSSPSVLPRAEREDEGREEGKERV